MILISAYGAAIRKIMLGAYDLDMLDGTYVFLCMENIYSACQGGSDGRDAEACVAFQGLININFYIPEGAAYNNFTYEVWRRMPEVGYNLSSPSEVSFNTICIGYKAWHLDGILDFPFPNKFNFVHGYIYR